jgi:hypothetical protein
LKRAVPYALSSRALLPNPLKRDIFSLLEKNMGKKVKLVQPTEIKDKKII